MTQPLDRNSRLPQLGKVDAAAGEFWVENPFMIPLQGKNLSAYEQNCVYFNLQGKKFLNGSYASKADIDSDSRSVIGADFDRDNRPDLLVGSAGGGPARMFANQLPKKNFVRINLVGKQSNRSAIGSRVILEIGEQKIVRDLFAQNGYMGQGPAELLIGIGDTEKIDKLSVRWPTGKTQTFDVAAVNETITIEEGTEEFVNN